MSKKQYFKSFSILIVLALCLSAIGFSQNKKRVNLIQADLLANNPRIVADAQRLLGNVNIEVDNALIWCDSLYAYTNNNIEAFGNVHIVRGDTLNMYSDYVYYQAAIKLAKARNNVKLIDRQTTLTTDSLDYEMDKDLAYYANYGTIKDSTNVLNSKIGQYFVNEKKAYFRTEVKGTTKDYQIESDTLIYYTETQKVYIEGPTKIFNEKDTLYSEFGWYDSANGIARLTKKSVIWNKDQKIKGDSIFYNKEKGEGFAFGHAMVHDFENAIIVKGNWLEYNDKTKTALATDSAVLIQYSKTDSLYLHADKLKVIPDTTKTVRSGDKTTGKSRADTAGLNRLSPASVDTTGINPYLAGDPTVIKPADTVAESATTPEKVTQAVADSTSETKKEDNRLVLAWNKVRFYRNDFQGKCDSLVYHSKDSTIQLFTDPVLWSEKNQISASYIEIIRKEKQREEVHMEDDAFIIAMEDDSIRFNQIKGRNMIGHIKNRELVKIDVDGNGQSNYYARDKNGIIGLNNAESSKISIYMNQGKVRKIAFLGAPEGNLKPLKILEEGEKILPGFNWRAKERPVSKDDIFRNPDENPAPLAPAMNETPEPRPIAVPERQITPE